MRRPKLLFGFCLYLLLNFSSVKANENSSPRAELNPRSIYMIHPWLDGAIIFTNTAFTVFAYSRPDLFISKRCPCSPDDVGAIDRPAIYNNRPAFYHFATAAVYSAVAVPVLLDYGELGWSKEFREDLTVFAEVLAVNQGLTTALKFSFQRPFPHRYNPDNHYPDEPGDFIAFPSGHTSTVAALLSASAMTQTLRHGASLWPWLIAGTVTTVVAFAMVHSGEHFTTDVIGGAVLGTAVGTSVPWLHSRQSALNGFAIAPTLSGAALIYAFRY